MMSGTVTYKSDLITYRHKVYCGPTAQNWNMNLASGAFPSEPYTITSAVIKFNVNCIYGGYRHMQISRDGGASVLGDVNTEKLGQRTEALSTSANYEGLSSIILDGVERYACELSGGSYIEIIVTWEATEPEVVEPQAAEPVVVTGEIEAGEAGEAMFTDVAISFDGVDITDEIEQCLVTFSYIDNEEDEADDLQIKLQDRDGKWLNKWLNETVQAAAFGNGESVKGLTISAGIKKHMPSGKIIKADCGLFELDSIKASGPASSILIKGTSLPYGNGVRTEERDKAWENYTLSGIGAEIAGKAGLGFMYDCPNDPSYARIEQAKQTDIAFLQQICHENGFSLKAAGKKLIIFDQKRYEALDAVATISWMDGTYTKYDLSTQEGDVHYDECRVKYYHPIKQQLFEGSAKAEDYDASASEHTVCVISNRAVESNAEASALAAKMLRLHNKYEKRCSFTLIGNPMIGSGMTVALGGFGLWSEKYIVKQAKHEVGTNGYTTKIVLRALPEGRVITVMKGQEEEKTSPTSGGTRDTTTKWVAKTSCAVYESPNSTKVIGHIAAGAELSVLSSTKGDKVLVNSNGIQGYMPTANLDRK